MGEKHISESDFNNSSHMTCFQKVPWRELWIPDIGIYNGRRRLELNMPDDMNRALIYSDGSILWFPKITFMSGCAAKSVNSVQVTKKQSETCS